MKEKLYLVQFYLPNGHCQDTEFGGTRIEVDRGSLFIYGLASGAENAQETDSESAAESIQMAFAPGIWRAVCEIDADSGYPLLPAYPRPSADDATEASQPEAAPAQAAAPAAAEPVAPAAPEVAPAPETARPIAPPAPAPELAAPPRQSGESPFGPKQQSSREAKRARIEQLAADLDKSPYMGLEAFCVSTGASRSEAEWALCAALISGRLTPQALEEIDQQSRLVQFGPDLIAKAGEAKLSSLIKALPQIPSLVGVDPVQVQIWLLRKDQPQA